MGRRTSLPTDLDGGFPTALARAYGVSRSRLKGSDLDAPFHGVRVPAGRPPEPDPEDPYERQRRWRIATARDYAPRQHMGHLFSHESAAAIWGAPLPLVFNVHGELAGPDELELHVCAIGATPLPRAKGVTRHRTYASFTERSEHEGLRVTSPAATWIHLGGHLSILDLVAAGDFFCRVWRPGYGRRHVGRAPLTTTDELRELLEVGRRRGAARLRAALELIRKDSWSPRESRVRCILVAAGLPEPDLNIDVHGDDGRFLGCVDMAYRELKVAIEYHGILHGVTWAEDVERIARLRAAGWTVIEVTSPLLKRPEELVERVRAAFKELK